MKHVNVTEMQFNIAIHVKWIFARNAIQWFNVINATIVFVRNAEERKFATNVVTTCVRNVITIIIANRSGC